MIRFLKKYDSLFLALFFVLILMIFPKKSFGIRNVKFQNSDVLNTGIKLVLEYSKSAKSKDINAKNESESEEFRTSLNFAEWMYLNSICGRVVEKSEFIKSHPFWPEISKYDKCPFPSFDYEEMVNAYEKSPKNGIKQNVFIGAFNSDEQDAFGILKYKINSGDKVKLNTLPFKSLKLYYAMTIKKSENVFNPSILTLSNRLGSPELFVNYAKQKYEKDALDDEDIVFLEFFSKKYKNNLQLWKFVALMSRDILSAYSKNINLTNSLMNILNIYEGSDYENISKQSLWLKMLIHINIFNDIENAVLDLKKFVSNTKTSEIQSTGYCWLGIIYEKFFHNKTEANAFFKKAEKYRTTFYGQIAARKLHKFSFDIQLNKEDGPIPKYKGYSKTFVEISKIYETLNSMNEQELARVFFIQLAKASHSKDEVQTILKLAKVSGNMDTVIAHSSGKSMRLRDIYPFLDGFSKTFNNYKPSLIHAIIRQESAFRTYAVSAKGAVGLMQLMPATALIYQKDVKKENLHTHLLDSKHNLNIGIRHVRSLMDRFNNSVILTLASYNAGEHNVEKWVTRFGDPRKLIDTFDVLMWIEQIPFIETRHYVKKAIAHMNIYSKIINNKEAEEVMYKEFVFKK